MKLVHTHREMETVGIFGSNAPSPVPPTTTTTTIPSTTESILSLLTETTAVEPLTINDIKMFESLDLDSSGSSGIGNSNDAIIEISLDETDSLLDDAKQYCKICK